jgi:LysM repeat protein
MNTPNPLIPQGSLLEQKAKGKPHLRVAYIIVAIHLVFLGGLLIQGCKKEDGTAKNNLATNDSTLPPLDQTNLYPTNAAVPSTNLPLQELAQPGLLPATNAAVPGSALQVPEAPATGTSREYIVLKGDSFYTIGKKFGVSAGAIGKANPGVDSTRLQVGQKLVVPAPGASVAAATPAGSGTDNVYVVKTGDSLLKIAKANATTVNEIKGLNGLKTDRIKVGDKLKMPAAKGTPATTPATTAPPPGGTGNL